MIPPPPNVVAIWTKRCSSSVIVPMIARAVSERMSLQGEDEAICAASGAITATSLPAQFVGSTSCFRHDRQGVHLE